MRRLLLALTAVTMAGVAGELLLLEHWEEPAQWVPFAVLVPGLASAAAVAYRPGRRTVRAFQAAMAVFVVTGAVGLALHYRGNAAFERELAPSLAGLALLWKAFRGATPLLAPGAFIQLGLLGLIAAYDHPALGPSGASTEEERT